MQNRFEVKTSENRLFVHLVYLDEAGVDGRSSTHMFGALVVPTGKFGYLSTLHEIAIQQIIPHESKEEFKEFHACDLYWGNEAFKGVKDDDRFTAITVLLSAIRQEKLQFIYSAVDLNEFKKSPLGTIPLAPLHFAFQMCLGGVERWARENHSFGRDVDQGVIINWQDAYLCILDELNNEDEKNALRSVYRSLRKKRPFHNFQEPNELWHGHDSMFFADSTDSLGIQIADLCSYFVQRKLEGREERMNFFDLFSDRITCAKPEPYWAQYKHLLRELQQ